MRTSESAERVVAAQAPLALRSAVTKPTMEPVQFPFTPYHGMPDLAAIQAASVGREVDMVSIADLLRNAFIYPPNSTWDGLKLANFGFGPDGDVIKEPKFTFRFTSRAPERHSGDSKVWVQEYHRRLCEAVTAVSSPMQQPWLLQSGGKDSTSIAIAVAQVRPDTVCMTYLGGREENELGSAAWVAGQLGLRHEILVCDPARAYDRYLAMVDRMPLLTGDFAMLSYADLVTEIGAAGGDGVLDGLGSDIYFRMLSTSREKLLSRLALDMPALARWSSALPVIGQNFELSYFLATTEMHPLERLFPGSRFTNSEVDMLLGRPVAKQSRKRLDLFLGEVASHPDRDVRRMIASSITEPMGGFAKGMYTADAAGMKIGYPYCHAGFVNWVLDELPQDLCSDVAGRTNKVVVRKHIGEHLGHMLPYVQRKGSFRFDLRGLAVARFDQVHHFSELVVDRLPGAKHWLERNRSRLDNKYHASKFYLLAVILPWLHYHHDGGGSRPPAAVSA